MSDFKAKMHQNLISAGALPQTPLGELTALPRPQLNLRGPTRKGKGYRKGGEGGEGGEGRGGKKGRVREGRKGGYPVCIFKFSLE